MSIYLTPQMLNPDFQSRETGERYRFFRRLFLSVVRKWRRRKMIAAFEALDDRVLQDIGINRSGIKRLVEGFDNQELRMVPVAPSQTSSGLEDQGQEGAVRAFTGPTASAGFDAASGPEYAIDQSRRASLVP